MKILIGTHNKNKFNQFVKIFQGLNSNIELFSLNDLKITEEIEEDCESLFENAKKKAIYYGEKSGMATIADDLGLFIDALEGEPGVHAKRWLVGTDKDRYLKILEKMQNIFEEKRTCRYKGAVVFYNPKTKEFFSEENVLEGKIAKDYLEGLGFGYDPIVLINGIYYSQFTDEERNNVSHRGIGIKNLLERGCFQ